MEMLGGCGEERKLATFPHNDTKSANILASVNDITDVP